MSTPEPTCLPCGNKIPGFADALAQARAEALAEAVKAVNDLHLTHPNTTGCWGGIGGSAMTEECAIDCPNPKHRAAQEAWRDICRAAAQAGEVRR